MIKYDLEKYQQGVQRVRDSRNALNELPEEIQQQVLGIVRNAVKGTYEACKEIYEPTTNPNEVERPGSDSDYNTDKKELANLSDLFN
jgi:hypothetical protein